MRDRLGRMEQAALAPPSLGQRSGNPLATAAWPEEKEGLDYIKAHPSGRWGTIGHLNTITWLWYVLVQRGVRNHPMQKQASRLLLGQPILLSRAKW